MEKKRIVVRIEIDTLSDSDGKLIHDKMDRLAMVLSNLHNSGKDLLLVTSGSIALGTKKLNIDINKKDYAEMMAAAAVGQAELIKLYQKYFDQYNQMVAQVLLTSDMMDHSKKENNTKNTFETLLKMGIIPIINENDAVSTADIDLKDNYTLALNVADVAKADIILIKTNEEEKYIIQPRNKLKAIFVNTEQELFCKLLEISNELDDQKSKLYDFPDSIEEFSYANN